uniref:Uncharacterized protein n=1 Tax=Arundo donax TaxID=35708 RepID=A0A0A9A748_ARUDO
MTPMLRAAITKTEGTYGQCYTDTGADVGV